MNDRYTDDEWDDWQAQQIRKARDRQLDKQEPTLLETVLEIVVGIVFFVALFCIIVLGLAC